MPTPTFATLDTATLDAVTGGGSSRAASEERITDKLQRITTAIADVAAEQQAGRDTSPMSQLMPLIAMKMMKRPAQ